MSIAGREFVTDYAFLLSSYNEHFVEFWQPMPAGFTTKGLTVYADDVLFTFFGLKGSINDLASFEHASLYWFIYGDGKAGSFSAAFNGRIDRMKVVRGTEQTLVVPVPDAGSTVGLLGFAIAGLGFLKRKLS